MRFLRKTTAFTGLLLAVGVAAGAQTPPPQPAAEPPASAFGEQIDVRVVNVEVVVTDKQGNRVAGLQPKDFVLRVDGKDVPVEYFSEVRGGQAIDTGANATEAPLPGLPSLAPGSPVGTSYLVFIDDYFTIAPRRNEVLRALKGQLGQLGPDDRMAIVAYDGRSLEMLSTWSNSERTLGRAFEQAIGREAYGFQRLSELRSFETTRRLNASIGVVPGPRSPFYTQLDLEEQSYAEQLAGQVERVTAAAASTLRGFAAPPGRKVMLLLAGTWPSSPADFAINNPNRPVLDRRVPRGEDLLRPLTDTANRLGYTLYPIDVPGLESNERDASLGAPSDTGINLREQEVHASFLLIADKTGGKALLNSLRESALPDVAADTRSYYWLGFTPAWQKNDARHQVTVEVTRPGLKVRSRDSFLDLSRKTEISMQVESAMLFGSAPGSNPLPMQLGKPVRAGRREVELPITLAIPADAITMVPLEGKHVAELELRVATVDAEGNRSGIPVIPLRLTLDDVSQIAGKFIRYDTKVRLRRIGQHLIVAIYDPLSSRIFTAEADVTP